MASYVLFSPTDQPDAWSIFAILAITLLPFSLVGPFVSVVLDRWSRRQIVVLVDICRCLIAFAAAGVVASGNRGLAPVLFGLLLVAMSLNRFAMAGLSAGLASTVDDDELLTASSVVPTIGPLGMLIGVVVSGGGRLALSGVVSPHLADAVVFVLAGLIFATSVGLGLRIPAWALGPEAGQQRSTLGQLVRQLLDAMSQVGLAPPRLSDISTAAQDSDQLTINEPGQGARSTLVDAGQNSAARRIGRLSLLTMAAQRFIFGFVFVAMVLIYRNHFNGAKDLVAAMSGLTLWVGLTGLGFVLASVVAPIVVRGLRIRMSVVVLLAGLGLIQASLGTWINPLALAINGFLIGLGTQCFKICIDTILQTNVLEAYKGRVFVLFDMLFNLALVSSALLGALVLPPSGVLIMGFVACGVGYLVLAGVFFVISSAVGPDGFDRGVTV